MGFKMNSGYEEPIIHIVNVGPPIFWMLFSIGLICTGVIVGFFISFWGSLYFLIINFIIYLLFYIFMDSLKAISTDIWLYSVDIQPLLLFSAKTEDYIVSSIPIVVFILLFFILNMIVLIVYVIFIKNIVGSRNIGIFNRIMGAVLGGIQILIFIVMIYGVLGSDLFYTNSVSFKQDLQAVINQPRILLKRHNDLSNSIFYKLYFWLNKI